MNINDPEISSNYIEPINKALQHMADHLEEELNLEIVSKVALFSPFHFHRLFKAITNESLISIESELKKENVLSVVLKSE